MKNNQRVLAAALVSAAFTAIVAQPASATVTPNLIGNYTTGVSGVTSGDNSPTISLTGGLPGGAVLPSTPSTYFNVDGLTYGGSAGDAFNDPNASGTTNGLLFTIDPASCLKSGCPNGTEDATITVNFTFYNSSYGIIGTASDTALAIFNYGSPNSDNICWNNTPSGTAVVAGQFKPVGTCGLPDTGLKTAYEQIMIDLTGQYYDINLYDWNDWNEMPQITFTWVNPPPSRVPEPASLALFGTGLMGFGFVMFRRRRTAAIETA